MYKFFKNRFTTTLVCICLAVVIGCEREEDIKPEESPPLQQLKTFSTQHTEAGVLKWSLVGESSEMRGGETIIHNPKVKIFEEGKVSLTLTGKRGQYFPVGKNKDNLYLYGEVVGVNENGTLYTEELHWRNKGGTIYSPTEVKLVRGDSTWYGIEMVANPNLETVKMSKNRFKLYPKDEEKNE